MTDWYNTNNLREYPIDESTTYLDDLNQVLPFNLICDLSIVISSDYTGVRLGSIGVSTAIISIVITSDQGCLMIGTFPRSSTVAYTAIALEAVADNTSGYVVFGDYSGQALSMTFSTAAQSLLASKAVKRINPPGVTKLTKEDSTNTVSGIIKLEASPELEIYEDSLNSGTIIIRLRDKDVKRFTEYCANEGSEDSCGVPVIRRINNVPATDAGLIKLRFS